MKKLLVYLYNKHMNTKTIHLILDIASAIGIGLIATIAALQYLDILFE